MGRCGSCWAFAVVSAFEVLYSTTHNIITRFSKQQIIDCCPGSKGCGGGNVMNALKYLVKVGLSFEKDYPLTGVSGICHSFLPIAAKAASIKQISNSENAMIQALRTSPLVALIQRPDKIRPYRSGVADPSDCAREWFKHAVVIVGHGPGYWIIRNTWGDAWGDMGHYLLKKGLCGVGRYVWSITL